MLRIARSILFGFSIAVVFSTHAEAQDKVRIMAPAGLITSFSNLKETLPNLELVPQGNPEQTLKDIVGCDGYIGVELDTNTLEAARKLRWIQIMTAGVEHIIGQPVISERNITVTNCKIVMGPQIADHAMALLLSITRNMRFYVHEMDKASWDRSGGLPLMELHGKTMLIIGLGGIGTQVAERAKAFGMRVIAVDMKDTPMMGAVEYVGKPDELDTLLPGADVVVSCVPSTGSSRKMLGAKQFEVMKKGAYVINVSRGAIIDTAALTAALQAGKLAGAGLDVTDPEPLPADSALWKMSNVVITPHIAGYSDGREPRTLDIARENIERFVNGRPLKNIVDIKAGF
jgi:phosphoglycerate dehydrogenase-like enzyme